LFASSRHLPMNFISSSPGISLNVLILMYDH
jgi:hypothetical protein